MAEQPASRRGCCKAMAKKPALTKLKIKQADSNGIITEVPLMVAPVHVDEVILPFGKSRREYKALQAQVSELITAVFAHSEEEFAQTTPTPGESVIVVQKIRQKRADAIRKVTKNSPRTLELIVRNFRNTPSSISMLEKLLDDTRYTMSSASLREAIVFFKAFDGESLYSVTPIIDNLRTCHPMLAREDLSELDDEYIELVKVLIRIAIKDREKANDKRLSKMAQGAFASDIEDARREILRCTPNMTPALTRVVFEHPEKLDQVLKALEERKVLIANSDSLVSGIMNASAPLSSGVL